MSESSAVDEIGRETGRAARRAGAAVAAIVDRAKKANPKTKRLSWKDRREARRQVSLILREERELERQELEQLRRELTGAVHAHHSAVWTGHQVRADEPMESWYARQQLLTRSRGAIEDRIITAPGLSDTDRGQAVRALRQAHYLPAYQLPQKIFTPTSGVAALRSRVQARIARFREVPVPSERQQARQWRAAQRWDQAQRRRDGGSEARRERRLAKQLGYQLHEMAEQQPTPQPATKTAVSNQSGRETGQPRRVWPTADWQRYDALPMYRVGMQEAMRSLPYQVLADMKTGRDPRPRIDRLRAHLSSGWCLTPEEADRGRDVLDTIEFDARQGRAFDEADAWKLTIDADQHELWRWDRLTEGGRPPWTTAEQDARRPDAVQDLRRAVLNDRQSAGPAGQIAHEMPFTRSAVEHAAAAGMTAHQIAYEIDNVDARSRAHTVIAYRTANNPQEVQRIHGFHASEAEASDWAENKLRSIDWDPGTKLAVTVRERGQQEHFLKVAGEEARVIAGIRQWRERLVEPDHEQETEVLDDPGTTQSPAPAPASERQSGDRLLRHVREQQQAAREQAQKKTAAAPSEKDEVEVAEVVDDPGTLDALRSALTDVTAERDRLKTERDEAVAKLVENTPPEKRYGSRQRMRQTVNGHSRARGATAATAVLDTDTDLERQPTAAQESRNSELFEAANQDAHEDYLASLEEVDVPAFEEFEDEEPVIELTEDED
ncbi:hypothetical protein AB0M12_41735 [Nocardia vinacea]|uniref:hypothetical protein n=1 Tax=Nocardia vinacea TaxID=96468 RepID=UPI00342C0562